MAAYEPKYILQTPNERYTDLTLYKACKMLVENKHREHDFTHIRNEVGSYVAFWSSWQNKVVPMMDANTEEKTILKSWFG